MGESNGEMEIEVLENDIRTLRKLLREKVQQLKTLKKHFQKNCITKLNNDEIARYSRQIILSDIGVQGQLKLKKASVLVVGAGGLGCPSALYLAGAGIGRIGVLDYDEVELTNLHRQLLHTEATIGLTKVDSVQAQLEQLNSQIEIQTHHTQLTSDNAIVILEQYDVIVDRIPIVYRPEYGVRFCGLQKLHPFDAAKGGNIYRLLKGNGLVQNDDDIYAPNEITLEELLDVHTKRYIESLKWSLNVAKIAEIPPLIFVPNCFVQRSYLRPMRYQTAGSILAARAALESGLGWAINLGGGFHHCSADRGGGFCPYADITLTVRMLQGSGKGVERILIVDLDAHQGNGYERDLMDDAGVFIMDMYNYHIYPRDHPAKLAIRRAVELKPHTDDEEYLRKLRKCLQQSLAEFEPNFIIYNAGTDVLKGDPLGLLDITPEGVIERDEIVFRAAMERSIPLVMLLSGGYLRSSARVIANSIINLRDKALLPTVQ
ncbi:histone deacetylase 11 isoform X1 [Anopheles ziemanni]|uniref:histone deacetylase 11 isoform X1 n=1 Tax=Anopheles coustani TaxID=139045 RepID=UPI00265B64F1|nr:histone deacetylase 11 isoform X1 [Anopheles coustani]XP_058174223.1 histone deacetylase 11 isoform X1 [Anopheles ziemanni]